MTIKFTSASIAFSLILGLAADLQVQRNQTEADDAKKLQELLGVPGAGLSTVNTVSHDHDDPGKLDYELKVCEGLPEIDKEKVMSILQTIEASYHRHERVAFMKMYTTSSLDITKFAYSDMYRTCKIAFHQSACNDTSNNVAIVLTGKTRYFMNQAILQFWKGVISAARASGRMPILLTVFDESEEKGVPKMSLVSRMEDFASKVKNPKLKSILTPIDEKEAAWFQEPAASDHRRRVIVLDSILQYEKNHDVCFSHIIYGRPDYIYPQWTNVNTLAYAWDHMNDVSYLVGNMTAIIPRRAAGAFFTTFAMHRTLQNEYFKSLLSNFFTDGDDGLMQPSTNLAYHGYLFAGSQLKTKYKTIPYPGFDDNHEPGFFITETGVDQYCVQRDQRKWVNLPACSEEAYNSQ